MKCVGDKNYVPKPRLITNNDIPTYVDFELNSIALQIPIGIHTQKNTFKCVGVIYSPFHMDCCLETIRR